jgi:hypothetical protein
MLRSTAGRINRTTGTQPVIGHLCCEMNDSWRQNHITKAGSMKVRGMFMYEQLSAVAAVVLLSTLCVSMGLRSNDN